MTMREARLEAFVMRLYGEGDLAMFCGDEVKYLAKKLLGVQEPPTPYESFLEKVSESGGSQ